MYYYQKVLSIQKEQDTDDDNDGVKKRFKMKN